MRIYSKKLRTGFLTACCICLCLIATSARAEISLSSFDEFDTSTEGWQKGNNIPANYDTIWTANNSWNGNPGYLISRSSGSGGAGGRQLMWTNESDWTGNYLGAGVGSVQFWVDNRSGIGSDIPLRIALNGPGGWFASDAKITSDTVSGNEWGVLSFDLNPTEFTWIAGGTNDFNATLSDVNILEVLAAQNTPTLGGGGVLRGDLIASDLRFDSFSVGASVPEPTSVSLACLSALGIAFRRKRNS